MSAPNRHAVTLTRDEVTLPGVQWAEYPVDEPPLIEAGGFRFYRSVWVKAGWAVTEMGALA